MADSESHLEPPERDLAYRMVRERPVPGPRFRGALGRALAAGDPGYGPRPPHLVIKVAGCVGAGAALVALGALQALGAL
jgi:hypothetical protein